MLDIGCLGLYPGLWFGAGSRAPFFGPLNTVCHLAFLLDWHALEVTTGDSFIRHHLKNMAPYQPILPFEVLSSRLGRKHEDIVKLDANENPYGRPPEVSFSFHLFSSYH
ncbi:hypothetical protein TSUD_278140 [Trifolium subterraneum]|uniref:Aminotransferase class I/classII domain-containing protein n=1 Tax=Trifolium subterraneum TaxID=3900 RepID=A0A2Z6NH67_TRISU|nr:hypothetical protein TSUD_278140 [Trifolium subterraneum]